MAAKQTENPDEDLGFSKAYWQQEGGGQWAEHVDRIEAVMQGLNEVLVDAAAPKAGESVLDIGCGGGLTSFAIAQRVGADGHVTGVDVSPRILAVAKRRHADRLPVNFTLGDAATADLGREKYDLLVSRFGLMFFDEPVAALTNIRKAMKKSGRLVAMVWQGLEENPWLSEAAKTVAALLPDEDGKQESGQQAEEYAPGPFALADPDFIRAVFSAAGFSKVALDDLHTRITLGRLESAVQFLLDIGPAASQLRDASPARIDKARVALGQLLQGYQQGQDIVMPAASWIIRASPQACPLDR